MDSRESIYRAVAGAFMVLAVLTINCGSGSPTDNNNGGNPPTKFTIVMEKPEDGAVFFLGDSVPCTNWDVLPSRDGLSTLAVVTGPSGISTRVGCGRPAGRPDLRVLLEWDLPNDPVVMDELGTWRLTVTATNPFGVTVDTLIIRWEVREEGATATAPQE